jgi:CubicO group peptidase (beta-lactamase class C family)
VIITDTGEINQKLDCYLTRITPYGFSGTVLVAQGDQILINKGYGLAIRDRELPLTADTVLSLGSITKQFTAAAILKLEMMGLIHTQDPIGHFLLDTPADKSRITLHHLLTHTAGLLEYSGDDYLMINREQFLEIVFASALNFTPGTQFNYSNAGYSLLAAIIEIVTGDSYEDFLRRHFFDPVGMSATGYRLPGWGEYLVAHWYDGDMDNGTPLDKPYPSWNLIGNGDMLSTTQDMFRWHQALLDERILSAQAKEKLFSPYINDYGYGWEVQETCMGTLITHNGASDLGSSAEFLRFIDQNVVIMLFCNQSYRGSFLAGVIKEKIVKLVFGGEVSLPPQIAEYSKDTLQRYEGEHQLPSGGKLNLWVANGALQLGAEGQDAINMLAHSGQENLDSLDELNGRIQSALQAVIGGDYTLLAGMLSEPDRRLPGVRNLVDNVLSANATQSIEVLGTLPSTWTEGGLDTFVKLKGREGDAGMILIMADGLNVGIAPCQLDSSQLLSVPFLPLSETNFAGYHLGWGLNLRLRFNLDDDLSVSNMEISTS